MHHGFNEAKLEQAIINLLGEQGFLHTAGDLVPRRSTEDVLIIEDLHKYLSTQYQADNITTGEIEVIIKQLDGLDTLDLYHANKTLCEWLMKGFDLKREDRNQKDLHIELMDFNSFNHDLALLFSGEMIRPDTNNIYRLVNQLDIITKDTHCIPDAMLYVNGLPLVTFEFKSAVRGNEASIYHAWQQLCVQYRRDIPKLFVYNALCIISDGVNNRMGNVFAPYEYYYTWRKITGEESVGKDGIDSLNTMIQGLFHPVRLMDVIKNFIYFPDNSNQEVKICCRYPQYYAARKLFFNVMRECKPEGSGKGGTYFGATGCGKSFTMQFLVRLLMKSIDLQSPTIILITDRTDLDTQLSKQFCNAKGYIGDALIEPVTSREHLRSLLKGRASGGVFLTTIHKFTEDIKLLSERSNIICISDEAHRSQINLDQKVRIDEKAGKVITTYGFAKYLHDSLPNATYVGFTGTPIDATLDVFGDVVDVYTMTESVEDEITVRIVYEGRAAKVILDNQKLEEIEKYYQKCEEAGANEHQVEESKKATAKMNAILGDPSRIKVLAADFVSHYEKRVEEKASIMGKAMFVCASREIAYAFYNEVCALRSHWFETKLAADEAELTDKEKDELMALPMVNMVMTRSKDDEAPLHALLGTKEYRKELDKQFKKAKSNFKIAIVVDMWLTGFDVPELDTIYIDKPLQKHNLIQTISRVNRKYKGKPKGLVVDYIGIKSRMNQALAMYSDKDEINFEDIQQSIIEVRNHLDLLAQMFHKFDTSDYFSRDPIKQLNCLNRASEFAMRTKKGERRFMALVKRLKAAYNVCVGSEELNQNERDHIHFYLAVRSIIFKLTRGNAPDTEQMNKRVREMIAEAIRSDGVEEIFTLGEKGGEQIDIFDADYIERINKISLPNTKIQLLQKMLAKAIDDFKKMNQLRGTDFSKRFKALVDKYNERKEDDELRGEEFDIFTDEVVDMIYDIKAEMGSFTNLNIDIEEKAFLDILKHMCVQYQFTYDKDKMLDLAKQMKEVVDDNARFPDWSKRDDIKAKLKVDLILLLHKFGFPPVANDAVYASVLEQAENYKKHNG